MANKLIIMMSGGLDSTVLFYKLYKEGYDILPLFINYGQHNAKKEYHTLLNILPDNFKNKLKIIDINSIYTESDSALIKEKNLWIDVVSEKDMYVPYRNLVLFSSAVAYAQTVHVEEVFAAFINTYYAKEIDASVNFLNSLESLMYEIGSVKIVLPFQRMSKLEVLRLGIEIGAPVTKSYSCQINSDTPCGACPNCVERLEAFKKL